ncbi:MAG TPA: YwqG family protein [Abditibacterium sp.]|jgi:uncharacterized protein YwqG
MTPAAQYAQKRAEAVELIRQHAPPRLQDALIELLRPAITLQATRADDSQIPLGASKFGGAPDVPASFEWPRWNDKPSGLLAQINLEEVAPFDVENLLPKSGVLLFFFFAFDTGYSENEAARVFHFENEDLIRLTVPEEFDGEDFQSLLPYTLTPQAEWTTQLPSDSQLTTEEFDQLYSVFFEMFDRPRPRHRLLGWPNEEQGPIADQCAEFSGDVTLLNLNEDGAEVNGKVEQWRLLFQMDADWKNNGTNYYMIRRSDLEAANFDDVWFASE